MTRCEFHARARDLRERAAVLRALLADARRTPESAVAAAIKLEAALVEALVLLAEVSPG